MTYVGLIGTNGAGKSTVCKYLQARGFHLISLSDYVRQEVTRRGMPLVRDNLRDVANMLKKEFGKDYLAKQAVDVAEHMGAHNVVFDSVRNMQEIIHLKNHGAVLIGVDAPVELRYERIKERKKDTDGVDFETFKEQDQRENDGSSYGQNIGECLKLCDQLIQNTVSVEVLGRQVDRFLEKWEES
jgi:dephospho-CoA kinase